MLDIFFYLTRL